jgi:phosphatidylglycerophosphate synthase
LPDSTPPRQWFPRTLDEWISLGRLILAGLLWIPAALRKPRLVALGIVVSGVSDIADGLVCRFRGERSRYSSQLDAIADSAVMLSSLGWLALARPGALDPLRRTLCVISLVASTLLVIEWRRYRMIGALHIDSARAAAVVGHLYVLNTLWYDVASKSLRRLFQLLVTGGMIESAWVILGPHDPMDGSPRPLLQWLKRIARA